MTNAFPQTQASPLDRRSFLKAAALLGAAAAMATLAGCGADDTTGTSTSAGSDPATTSQAGATAAANEPTSTSQDPAATPAAASGPAASGESASTTAVVYFSVPLTDSESRDADSGASIVMVGDDVFGNVQYAAQFVAAASGGDLIRIVPDTPYATDDSVFDYALAEQNGNARPAISLVAQDGTTLENLDAYDTVLVGYPIWWYELPMPLYTFFENYDLSGKRVAPFVVHGGSGLSGTVQDIEALQPDAQVVEGGLSINRRDVQATAEARADEWVEEQGL